MPARVVVCRLKSELGNEIGTQEYYYYRPACIAGVILPLKYLLVREVGLIGGTFKGSAQGIEVSGTVEYYRGGKGPQAIPIGAAEYSQATHERSYSTEKILAGIESGEI
jgi:hypothetical protein